LRELLPCAEFAGAVFSSDGHTLFVNVLAPHGMTVAIRGRGPGSEFERGFARTPAAGWKNC
jgi:secreted PhoX family phosphatase